MYIKRTIKKTISPTWSEVIAHKKQTFKTTLTTLTFSLAYFTFFSLTVSRTGNWI